MWRTNGLTRDGTVEPASRETKWFSGVDGNREIFISPVQLSTGRTDNDSSG